MLSCGDQALQAESRSTTKNHVSKSSAIRKIGAYPVQHYLAIVMGAPNVMLLLRAQSTGKYDVVSIKPHPQGDRAGMFPQFLPGGEFKSINIPLLIVIAFAYNVPFQGEQISGGPAWLRSPDFIFDIDAKSDTDVTKGLSPEARDENGAGRPAGSAGGLFKLKARREMQDQPVYFLTIAKNGPKLQPSKLQPKDCDENPSQCHTGGAGQGRGIHTKAATMHQVVIDVSNFTDLPLLDRTGLKGLSDIDTDGWVSMRPRPPRPPGTEPTAEDLAFADPARPTLYQIFDRLGLRMEKLPGRSGRDHHRERPKTRRELMSCVGYRGCRSEPAPEVPLLMRTLSRQTGGRRDPRKDTIIAADTAQ